MFHKLSLTFPAPPIHRKLTNVRLGPDRRRVAGGNQQAAKNRRTGNPSLSRLLLCGSGGFGTKGHNYHNYDCSYPPSRPIIIILPHSHQFTIGAGGMQNQDLALKPLALPMMMTTCTALTPEMCCDVVKTQWTIASCRHQIWNMP